MDNSTYIFLLESDKRDFKLDLFAFVFIEPLHLTSNLMLVIPTSPHFYNTMIIK